MRPRTTILAHVSTVYGPSWHTTYFFPSATIEDALAFNFFFWLWHLEWHASPSVGLRGSVLVSMCPLFVA